MATIGRAPSGAHEGAGARAEAPRGQGRDRRETDGTWRDQFNRVADRVTSALGSATAVAISVLMVIVWAVSGPLFGFSDSWQLVINTTTTVITFWMVFVIQNSQNRDARAIHLKLDEIIRASRSARNEFIVAEKETEAQVEAHESELQELGDRVSRHHGSDDVPGESLDDGTADAEPSQGAAEDAAPRPEPASEPARDRQAR